MTAFDESDALIAQPGIREDSTPLASIRTPAMPLATFHCGSGAAHEQLR